MNGAECGKCGKVQCTCDRYPQELALIRHQLEEDYRSVEQKQLLAMKGILLQLDRIETKGKLEPADRKVLAELVRPLLVRPLTEEKKWWQFWK